ncbi:unnamed protein product [Penicillium salamii]|uniref:Uncharacterized protein n=1 Tax=Penicillium salamii TaxID=1612424 RepID=A0A9W4IUF4_9EURO|nr:unnamed protein product [Penicillium salamii]CAG8046937.1 unnamed protein product [Penicillium salamii]CAG8337741.1 unnamed protein product [Penicillium salamii]CAG8337765.1 unnamed protein product [Penicillium salamii]CAG8346145.1 unnamed protein product [Penicillium salamii]
MSNISGYNVSKNYYNLNPIDFGLNYSIFQFPDDSAMDTYKRGISLRDLIAGRKAKRVDITKLPPICWDDCGDAAREPMENGKTAELCKSDSVFKQNLENCENCVTNNGDSDSGSEAYSSRLLPTFAQWLNFCSDMPTSTTTSKASTTTESRVTTTTTSRDVETTPTSTDTTRATITSTEETSTTKATATATTTARSETETHAESSVSTVPESTDGVKTSSSTGESSSSPEAAHYSSSSTISVPGLIVTTSVSGSLITTSLPGSVVTSVFSSSASDSPITTSVPASVVTTSVSGSLVTTSVSGTLMTSSVSGSFVTTSIPGSIATIHGTSSADDGGENASSTSTRGTGDGSSDTLGGSRTASAGPSSSSPAFNMAISMSAPHLGALSLCWAAVAALF